MSKKIYRCKESFSVELCDDDGFRIPNKEEVIEAGKEYILDETGSTIIGGEVHLDCVKDGSWVELSRVDLEKLFEFVKDGDSNE